MESAPRYGRNEWGRNPYAPAPGEDPDFDRLVELELAKIREERGAAEEKRVVKTGGDRDADKTINYSRRFESDVERAMEGLLVSMKSGESQSHGDAASSGPSPSSRRPQKGREGQPHFQDLPSDFAGEDITVNDQCKPQSFRKGSGLGSMWKELGDIELEREKKERYRKELDEQLNLKHAANKRSPAAPIRKDKDLHPNSPMDLSNTGTSLFGLGSTDHVEPVSRRKSRDDRQLPSSQEYGTSLHGLGPSMETGEGNRKKQIEYRSQLKQQMDEDRKGGGNSTFSTEIQRGEVPYPKSRESGDEFKGDRNNAQTHTSIELDHSNNYPTNYSIARQRMLEDVYGSAVGSSPAKHVLDPRAAEQARRRTAAIEQQRMLQVQIDEKRRLFEQREEQRISEERSEQKRQDEERRRHEIELQAAKLQRQREEEDRLEQLRAQEEIAAQKRRRGSTLSVRRQSQQTVSGEQVARRDTVRSKEDGEPSLLFHSDAGECHSNFQISHMAEEVSRNEYNIPPLSPPKLSPLRSPINANGEPQGMGSGSISYRSSFSAGEEPFEQSLAASSRLLDACGSRNKYLGAKRHLQEGHVNINEQSLTSDSLLMYLSESQKMNDEDFGRTTATQEQDRPLPVLSRTPATIEEGDSATASTLDDEVIVVNQVVRSEIRSPKMPTCDSESHEQPDEEPAQYQENNSSRCPQIPSTFAIHKPNQSEMDALLESSLDEGPPRYDYFGDSEISFPLHLPSRPMPWHYDNASEKYDD